MNTHSDNTASGPGQLSLPPVTFDSGDDTPAIHHETIPATPPPPAAPTAPAPHRQQTPAHTSAQARHHRQGRTKWGRELPSEKGRTLLVYEDGTLRPRPPLHTLVSTHPKMAAACWRNETPKMLKVWWSPARPAPSPLWLTVGVLTGWAVCVGILVGLPAAQAAFLTPQWAPFPFLVQLFAKTSALSGAWWCAFLASSGARRRRRAQAGTEVAEEHPVSTVLSFIPIAVWWGPVLPFVVTGTLAVWAVAWWRDGDRR